MKLSFLFFLVCFWSSIFYCIVVSIHLNNFEEGFEKEEKEKEDDFMFIESTKDANKFSHSPKPPKKQQTSSSSSS